MMRVICTGLFFSVASRVIILGDMLFTLISVFISYLFIVVRGTLPRYRYDKLIDMC